MAWRPRLRAAPLPNVAAVVPIANGVVIPSARPGSASMISFVPGIAPGTRGAGTPSGQSGTSTNGVFAHLQALDRTPGF